MYTELSDSLLMGLAFWDGLCGGWNEGSASAVRVVLRDFGEFAWAAYIAFLG